MAEELNRDYSSQKKEWQNSPFKWILGLTSRQRGAVGEQLVRKFLKEERFAVTDSPGTDSDISVNGYNVEIKFSTLWQNGGYRFQQIRDQDYDILLCLGISPNDAHAWVVTKSNIVWNEMPNQHGGSRGSDTWWITCHPSQSPYEWLLPSDGDLGKMLKELRKLTGQPT